MTIKSTIIIISTLLIGFALGVLSTGRFVQSQVNNLQQLRDAPMKKLMETIQPNEAQQQQLEPILEKYAADIKQLNRQHKENIQQTIDSLLTTIKPILTTEQLTRIETQRQKLREREKQGALPPFKRGFFRQMKKQGLPDSLSGLPQRKPVKRTDTDSTSWRQKMQQRPAAPPEKVKEIIRKKKQGIPLSTEDSMQLREFREQQRQKRVWGNANDSLALPRNRFNKRPRPLLPNDSLPELPRKRLHPQGPPPR